MKISNYLLRPLPAPVHKVIYPLLLPIFYFPQKKKMLRIYSHFVSKGDLVFDVGANEGYMTEVFLKLGAKVICIEPHPECAVRLRKKFKGKNVVIIDKGIADKKGELIFNLCEKRPMISTFSKEPEEINRKDWKEIKVPVTTLDSLIKEYGVPKFCKIDVEGFELNVIKGLNRKVHYLCFEFHRVTMDQTKACIKHLESLGKARFNFSLYNRQKLMLKKWISSKELFEKLSSIKDKNLNGDIYVTLD